MTARSHGGWLSVLAQRVRRLFRTEAPSAAPEAAPFGRPYPWESAYPPGVSWDIEIAPQPVFRLLDDAVAAWGEKVCLEFFGKKYSYREVGDLVERAAKGFQELGVGKGVRVGLLLPNSPFYVICYHAILRAGGTVVNYNPLYAAREIDRQIRDSETRIMVTMNLETIYPKVAAALGDGGLETIVVCRMSRALPFPGNALFALFRRRETSAIPDDSHHITFSDLIAVGNDPVPVSIEPERDIAVLQYTGGTTGIPKGAMLTHANLYANALQTRSWAPGLRLGEEKILAVLPLFHVFGMTGAMNVGLHVGARIILMPRFKVADVLAAIDKAKPTVLLGVPTMYSAINGAKDLSKFTLSSLEICISGGAPLPVEIKRTFEGLTGCVLVEGYGLTEAGPVCAVNPIGGLNKPGSAGLPIPGTVIEIMALDDRSRRVPPGTAGEICITGPQVMVGYLNAESDTAEVLRDGRLHTGDVGYLDDDGYVFLIDRIKDLIITGGFNVYPRMVEEAVCLHPDVAEAAACGVPSQHRGEIVKAFVVVRPGAALKAADLRAFLRDKLAPFEQPRQIEFVDEIPKTFLGKPLRRELVALEILKTVSGTAEAADEPPDAPEPTEPADPPDSAAADKPGDGRARDRDSELTAVE